MNKSTYWIIGSLIIAILFVGAWMTKRGTAENPAPANSAKIDINAVCEGALAYMTFPSGEAAAQFVAECKEGRHPEVIEKYKKDAGITNDAAI